MADEFARVVRSQWLAELETRRLNAPNPLSVRWVQADPTLVDEWDVLKRAARSRPNWPAAWGPSATGSEELAGEGNQLGDVLTRVPTGRLVVLVERGAGKTTLMVRLVLDLLEKRRAGHRARRGPVRVLVSVAAAFGGAANSEAPCPAWHTAGPATLAGDPVRSRANPEISGGVPAHTGADEA